MGVELTQGWPLAVGQATGEMVFVGEMQTMKRELAQYLLLTFGFSWILWVPQALNDSGLLSVPDSILSLSKWGAMGPLVAVLLLTALKEGGAGLKRLLKSALRIRLGWKWYVVIFATFPAVLAGSLLLAGVRGAALVTEANSIVLLVGFFVILFTGGPIQEEFGWRGYMLDRLQAKWSALLSSVIVGFVWGLWHLPLFFMNREEDYYSGPVWGLFASTILISILFTWIYNNTGKSMFGMLMFHTMWNWSHWVFPTLGSADASAYMLGALAVIAALVLWRFTPQRLVRGEMSGL